MPARFPVVTELQLRAVPALVSRTCRSGLRKFTTPVAVPLTLGGLASLMTVYGSMAAPDAVPVTKPRTYGGRTSVGP